MREIVSMNSYPEVRIGLIAVSRDCFPQELSRNRRDAVAEECKKRYISLDIIETIVESEADVITALKEISDKEINTLAVYLGNFGPEGPGTLLASRFTGPVIFAGAAEESGSDLMDGRGDAYCGMLNAAYSLGLRNIRPFIPEEPIGTPVQVSQMIEEFIPIARTLLGLSKLKIISFGPRPQDFLACNAPIKPLYDLGIEIMENSELDLYEIYKSMENDPRVDAVAREMVVEQGVRHSYPGSIRKMACYETALIDFMEKNLVGDQYIVFANKCWPAFERFFGFVPCYVNSRLTARGIPVSCEVDIYGALSEFMAYCVTGIPVTLLDINNTVPENMYRGAGQAAGEYRLSDLFMGFHCGNTPSSCLINPELSYQKIMYRLMEEGKEPDITVGTMEGVIKNGPISLFRLQATATAELQAYVAQGEILNIDPQSFGSIGVFAVHEMARFYRHVLIERQFPHHTAVAFDHVGRTLFSVLTMLGIKDKFYNIPAEMKYPTENPF